MDFALEFCSLACQILGVVLLGKGDVHGHFFTGNLVQQLLFKAGNEAAAAQDQGLHFGGAAGKLLAVAETGVVQNHLIAVLGRTVLDGGNPGILLAQPLQLLVHFLLGHDMSVQFGLQAAIGKAHGVLLCFYMMYKRITFCIGTVKHSGCRGVFRQVQRPAERRALGM